MMVPPTADYVKSVLDYDPVTGEFIWKTHQWRSRVGKPAGFVHGGYRFIGLQNGNFRAHRIAWLYVQGRWPTNVIDHIDRNSLNNAIDNLREATIKENRRNREFKGVVQDHRRKTPKFRARIRVDGRDINLGSFNPEAEARAAYIAGNIQYFGEFSAFQERGSK